MAQDEQPKQNPVEQCLKRLGLSLLCDWDVLIFLYRHQFSLSSADQMGRLLGYASTTVADALDRLESQGLVERSRSSQGVRFHRLVISGEHLALESCFQQLIGLAESRRGRLLVVQHLRQDVGLTMGVKGKTKWQKRT